VRRNRGVTLVMVTHDPQVAAIADERLVLRDGRPVVSERERGEPAEVSPLARVEP
jgi:putative ABC transport system ATP-binding protein